MFAQTCIHETKVPVEMIAKTIRTCFPIAVAAVADKAEEINKLNVFPVPDGDTGTNMSLTLQSVVKELAALPVDADMEVIAGAITHGSLMGARGNSGVITSQILRGVAEDYTMPESPSMLLTSPPHSVVPSRLPSRPCASLLRARS